MTWHDALLYTQVKCFDWATQATKQGFSDFWTQLFEFNAMLVEQNANRSRIKRVKLQQGAMTNVWNAEMSLGWYMMIRACKPSTSSKKVKNHGTTGDNHLSAFSLQLDCPWRSPPAWHLLRSSPNSLGRCDLTFSLALISDRLAEAMEACKRQISLEKINKASHASPWIWFLCCHRMLSQVQWWIRQIPVLAPTGSWQCMFRVT